MSILFQALKYKAALIPQEFVVFLKKGNPKHKYRWAEGGSRAALRRPWGYWWMRSSTRAGNVRLEPRKPPVPWAASRAAWPAGQGR